MKGRNGILVMAGLAIALAIAAAAPALGADEPKTEFGVLFGGGSPDKAWTGESQNKDALAPVFGVRGAYLFCEKLALFGDITYARYNTADPSVDADAISLRVGPELLLPRISKNSRFFISGALGFMDVNMSKAEDFSRTFAGLGFGQRFITEGNNVWRWELRAENSLSKGGLDGRDITNAALLFGYSFGSTPPDSDGDGVTDCNDACADTPRGAVVDTKGCPLDSDGDGVYDGIDRCPDTPRGWPVDSTGCPLDSDGDGVPDGADRCPGTPQGVKVDASGCPLDSDGDGVTDDRDRCPGTPKGVAVDVNGCPPPPPPPPPAPPPIPQALVLEGVVFASDSAELEAVSTTILDTVAGSLVANPGVRVEIGGHTDSTHTNAHNQALSEKRARAVAAYLVSKGVKPGQLTTKGYGEDSPIADNATPQGRAKNRRVEMKRLN
jgi:OOP family OmpA-OmpF porin